MGNKILLAGFCLFVAVVLRAQDNYEIQVYGSQTQAPRSTMFELHSNYTFNGIKVSENGVLPSHHAVHETLEITTGLSPVFELGVYLFTAYIPGHGYQVVGSHLRPRVMVPAGWNLPMGLSLSTEIGYQKPDFATSTWSFEIRPIIDKQWRRLYAAFNPTFGVSLASKYEKSTPTFEPNIKVSYTIIPTAALGLEYYGNIGYINSLYGFAAQNDALFLSYDMLSNPRWELNVGAGFGITSSTDKFVFKVILGRRVGWQKASRSS